jgi:hypothetical protein
MSMLSTHFSNLSMTPAIVKKLMGFKVNSVESSSSAGAASKTTVSLSNYNKMCEKNIKNLVKKLRKTPGGLDELERAITSRDPNTKCIVIPTK